MHFAFDLTNIKLYHCCRWLIDCPPSVVDFLHPDSGHSGAQEEPIKYPTADQEQIQVLPVVIKKALGDLQMK